ncbi:appr-1-p processing enzyme family domain-containing protein [Deltaproteobacteria bacterium Smac51]|nr:appr-1-p processing enzyme family domain-containing protein [Deltaproteobacteria bacterium Smac51]
MRQDERLDYLINYLIGENPANLSIDLPDEYEPKRALLRGLMNIRLPRPLASSYLEVQDDFLREELRKKGVVNQDAIKASSKDKRLALWQGDITRLAVDAIVNAANSQLLGCFIPNHGCIDNAIHSAAGLQLRQVCHDLMSAQNSPEPVGHAKITPAFNLPSRYVIHTVGPVFKAPLNEYQSALLSDCYRACLELAAQTQLRTIAFCCISTGEFCFPNQEAAEIAVSTVINFLNNTDSDIEKVIFNVFKPIDYEIYTDLLK